MYQRVSTFWYLAGVTIGLTALARPGLCGPTPAIDGPGFQPQPSNSVQTSQYQQEFLESVYAECTEDKSSLPCFKHKLFAFVDRIMAKDEISLAQGVTVVKTGAPRSLDKLFEQEDASNSADIATALMSRVKRFLSTRSLKVDIKGIDILNAVSAGAERALHDMSAGYGEGEENVEEARKKKGGGGKKGSKMMGHMLMMMKMKLLGLIPLLFGLIALMAGKALLLGKLALLLSLIVLLKKLAASHHKTVTYEVVGHGHSSAGHDSYSAGGGSDYSSYGSSGGSAGSGHGGWGRSGDAHSRAYNAYKPLDSKSE